MLKISETGLLTVRASKRTLLIIPAQKTMLRLTLLVTGVISFIYFFKPDVFEPVKSSGEKVLGIKTLNQSVNIETVKTALLIHCINKNKLPEKLNDLYEDELAKEKYLDLEKIFSYSVEKNCEFNLTPK